MLHQYLCDSDVQPMTDLAGMLNMTSCDKSNLKQILGPSAKLIEVEKTQSVTYSTTLKLG